MQLSLLDQSMRKFNKSTSALNRGANALSKLRRIPMTNIMPQVERKFNKQLTKEALIGQNRRAKGSAPVGRLKDGSVLFSDGSIQTAQQANIAQPTPGTGFNGLELPQQDPHANEINLTLPGTEEATLQSALHKLANPFEPITPVKPEQRLVEETPVNPQQAMLQMMGRIPADVRNQIKEFVADPEEARIKIRNARIPTAPKAQIIASSAPARYHNSTMITTHTPQVQTQGIRSAMIRDIISQWDDVGRI